MLSHWIWLATREHIGDRVKAELVRHFQDPEIIYFADESTLLQFGTLSREAMASLADKDMENARKIIGDCRRKEIGILTYRDAAYPSRLKHIPDPPLVLYYKGRLPDFDATAVIGVVGTRKASAYGMSAARKIGYQISRCGGMVVSGMAAGIDAMATQGALLPDVPAVGVLGCGADIVYPPSNRKLFEDMRQYGCLLSEFVPGTPPARYNFPRRNRIISGLSCGVLVVEAPRKSGALITARAALDQGRDVFVVPGNIDVDTCEGSNSLLRDGAVAVSSGWDIMSEYQMQYPDSICRWEGSVPQKARDTLNTDAAQAEKIQPKAAQSGALLGKNKNSKQNEDKKVIDNGGASPYSDWEDKMPPLLPDEQKILSALTSVPRPVDDVIAETGIPTARMLAMLTMLQVKGIVRQHPGKRISLR